MSAHHSILIALSIASSSARAAEGDFVPLSNGRDYSGWRFGDSSAMPEKPPAAWKITDGVLVGAGDPAAILASQWDYADFEMEFDWRALADDFDPDFFVHAGRVLQADPIRLTKELAGGPQETDRGEGLYNASATGSLGGGSTWLVGRPTVDRYPMMEVDPKFPDARGIGLQAHAPWKEVRFHNIRMKTLN
jgi:hypothetical protein